MARARLYRPVTDEMGNLIADIQVRLIDPETNQTITVPVYDGPVSSTPVSQPILFQDGIISLYLDAPRRVRIGVKKGLASERFYEDIDVLVTSLEGIAASAVSFVPGDDLAADDVQEAIVEVHTEGKAALQAHLDDATDAHDASAISFTPANNIDALDVQGALAEVGASIQSLEAAPGPDAQISSLFVQFGAAMAQPLVKGVPAVVDWTSANYTDYREGNDVDLTFDRALGRMVVNTPGYYAFSAAILMDGFPDISDTLRHASATLSADANVTDQFFHGVVPNTETFVRYSATTQVAWYDVGYTARIQDIVAYWVTGTTIVLDNVFFAGSRIR